MGVLSDLGKLALTYEGEVGGPPSVVRQQAAAWILYASPARALSQPHSSQEPLLGAPRLLLTLLLAAPCQVIMVAKGVDGSREGAVASGSYTKERRFYEQLQDQVPLRSPKLLASFKDAVKPDEWFCLVMEDMGTAGFTVMNQVDGMTVDQTKAILVPLAKLHGLYWKHSLVEEAWLNNPVRCSCSPPTLRRTSQCACSCSSALSLSLSLSLSLCVSLAGFQEPTLVRHVVRCIPREPC
jgi:hypothetical protein